MLNNVYDNKFRYLFTSVARSFLFEYSDDRIYQILNDKSYKTNEIVLLCKEIDLYVESISKTVSTLEEKIEKLTSINTTTASTVDTTSQKFLNII